MMAMGIGVTIAFAGSFFTSGSSLPTSTPPKLEPHEIYGYRTVWHYARPSMIWPTGTREWKVREWPNEAMKSSLNSDPFPEWFRGYEPLNKTDYEALQCKEWIQDSKL